MSETTNVVPFQVGARVFVSKENIDRYLPSVQKLIKKVRGATVIEIPFSMGYSSLAVTRWVNFDKGPRGGKSIVAIIHVGDLRELPK